MKKINLMLAVLSILAIVAFAGPALAQNWETETVTHTVGSKFFGFAPTESNISTFMDMNLALSNADGTLWTSDDYIRGTFLPGAWTSRADRIVSTSPDWGCGFFATQEANCVEAAQNHPDRVLTDGANTAPVGANSTGGGASKGGANTGMLTGNMVSFVTLDDVDSDMPFGTILFSRSSDLFFTISQNITHNLAGFYTFNETDFNSAPIPVFTLGRDLGFVGGTPLNMVPSGGIRGILTISQEGMGNHQSSTYDPTGCDTTTAGACGAENISNDIVWFGNGSHPQANAYFTPGLNVGGTVGGGPVGGADWAGNAPTVDNAGFP
jgi:hypothetical protein